MGCAIANSDGRFLLLRMLPAVFCVSFSSLGWQLAFMRCLQIARYHHFAFVVISCALLGFGVGGLALALRGSWFRNRAEQVFRWGVLLFALSLPLCFTIGERIPLTVYFTPVVWIETLGWWCLFWLIHAIPFFLGGLAIGIALIMAGPRVHALYAASLVGSACGALAAVLLLSWIPANALLIPFAGAVLASALLVAPWSGTPSSLAFWGTTGGSLIALILVPILGVDLCFPLGIDEYKPLAYMQGLVKQGVAQHVVRREGPRSRVDLFASPHFHTLLSLNPSYTPPQFDELLRDGLSVGSVARIGRVEEAGFLEGTLQALPYRLIMPERVLILGETSGLHIWLARISGARTIVVVQPDSNIVYLLKTHESRVLDDPRVQVVLSELRAFLDRTAEPFDLIIPANLQGFSAGSSGIGGLLEDHLATTEGFMRCLELLTPRGMVALVRGLQDPPRDDIKIAATWIEALERRGEGSPGNHLLMARDELSFAGMVSRNPVVQDTVSSFRTIIHAMGWDVEWFPGIRADETNRVHVLPGPEGTGISWFHHAMRKLLSPEREQLYRTWLFNVVPSVDDRPFFHDFFRWQSIPKLREIFGPLWPTRSEMGFLLLVVATVITGVVAFIALPLPVLFLSESHREPLRRQMFIIVYFGSIGVGFMCVEMNAIQLYTRFLGHSVLAAALTVGSLLFFAGIGSMIQPRVTQGVPGATCIVCATIALLSLIFLWSTSPLLTAATDWALEWRILASVGTLAIPGLLMGMPFPWAMSRLTTAMPHAAAMAWAVNGFASVVGTCVAVVIAMTYGFRAVMSLAAILYVAAGLTAFALPRPENHLQPTPQKDCS